MEQKTFKSQLKDADERTLAVLINSVNEQLLLGRYRKVDVQRNVVMVLSQRKPRVNAVTRDAYQAFIYNVCGVAAKNQEIMKKARTFAKANNLEWK